MGDIDWKKAESIAGGTPSVTSLHCKVPENQKISLEKSNRFDGNLWKMG